MTGDPDWANKWHADRRRGLGGSDMGKLFNLPEPYGGCRRALWYDKSGILKDIADPATRAMIRGTLLEDAAAEQYTADTGRILLKTKRSRVHAEDTWARVNIDRGITPVPEHVGRGVLEIKTMAGWPFQKMKREGLPEAYILQMQHALYVTGCAWGAFSVLNPDSWTSINFDVEADAEAQEIVAGEGRSFWSTVGDPGLVPEKLSPDDARCKRCAWRISCQGEPALYAGSGISEKEQKEPLDRDETFAELLADYADVREEIEGSTALLEKIKVHIKERMAQHNEDAIECSAGRIYWRPHVSQRFDVAAFKAAEPALYKKFAKPIETRPLRAFPIRGGER